MHNSAVKRAFDVVEDGPSFSAPVLVWAPSEMCCHLEFSSSVGPFCRTIQFGWDCSQFHRLSTHHAQVLNCSGQFCVAFSSAGFCLHHIVTAICGQKNRETRSAMAALSTHEAALPVGPGPAEHGPHGHGTQPHSEGQLDGVWLNADCPWEYYTVSCRKMLNGSQGITELLMWEDLGEIVSVELRWFHMKSQEVPGLTC